MGQQHLEVTLTVYTQGYRQSSRKQGDAMRARSFTVHLDGSVISSQFHSVGIGKTEFVACRNEKDRLKLKLCQQKRGGSRDSNGVKKANSEV